MTFENREKWNSFLFNWLHIGFLLFLFAMFASPSTKMANSVFYAFVLFPFILSIGSIWRDKACSKPVLTLIFLILFWTMFSFYGQANIDWHNVLKRFRHSAYIIVFILSTHRLLSSGKVTVGGLIGCTLGLALFSALYAMVVMYGWKDLGFSSRLTSNLRLGSPIAMAVIVVVFGLPCVIKDIGKSRYVRAVIFFIFMMVVLFFCNTRAAYVGLLGGVIVFFVFFETNNKRILGISILLLVVAAFIIFQYGGLLNRGGSFRIDIWLSALSMVGECGWLLGCGFGHSMEIATDQSHQFYHPHSIYISHLINTGAIGIISLFIGLAWLITKGIHVKSTMIWGLIAGLLAMVFDGKYLITNPDEVWLILWLPVALVLWEIKNRHLERPVT